MTVSSEKEHVSFDVKALLHESWAVYKADAVTFVAAMFFYLVIVGIGDWKLWIAGTILNGPLLMGLMRMAQCGARREPVRFADMFIGFEYFLPALLLGVICHVLVAMGLLGIGLVAFFLVLPAFLFILEMECGTKCAMITCWDMVRDNIREWLFLSVVLAAITIVTVPVTLGLGLLITGPVTLIAVAKAYDLERGTCCSAAATPAPRKSPRIPPPFISPAEICRAASEDAVAPKWLLFSWRQFSQSPPQIQRNHRKQHPGNIAKRAAVDEQAAWIENDAPRMIRTHSCASPQRPRR